MSEYHEQIDRLFYNYCLLKKGKGNRALKSFHDFSSQLLRHIECEEEIVFPLFDKKYNSISSSTYMLKKQHIQIKKYLGEIDAAKSRNIYNKEEVEKELKKLLACHNATEEYTVYSWLDSILYDDEKQSIIAALQVFNHQFLEKRHTRLKYLSH